jgi:electron transfer flavoprotein alpha subunit
VSRILVFVEHDDGHATETSRQALTMARTIGEVDPVSVGPSAAGGWQIEHGVLSDYAPAAIAEALAQLVGARMPAAVMAAGTERGNEVMAHLAALLDLPLAANVTRVAPSGEEWKLTRVRWGGSLLEECTLTAVIKLATVALHSIDAAPIEAPSPVTIFTPDLTDAHAMTRVTERVTLTAGITLTTAPVVVSGGRGVGSAEGFGVLEELASLIGGAVGCSRVVTNSGWRPHSDQVGQTGTRVAPHLYIACGISGAIQHWVGMMASKNVLAINTDVEAPMVTKADYAVIGDLHPILDAIVAEVKRRQGL